MKNVFLFNEFVKKDVTVMEEDIKPYLTHIWVIFPSCRNYPAGIYLFKVDNRNTRTMYEVCSKLTIKTPERRHWCLSGIFIVNFEQISHIVLKYLLLTLNKLADWQMLPFSWFIVQLSLLVLIWWEYWFKICELCCSFLLRSSFYWESFFLSFFFDEKRFTT